MGEFETIKWFAQFGLGAVFGGIMLVMMRNASIEHKRQLLELAELRRGDEQRHSTELAAIHLRQENLAKDVLDRVSELTGVLGTLAERRNAQREAPGNVARSAG